MSTTNLIIGLALGVLLGAVMIAFRNRFRDVFAMLLVFGIVVLAVAVTIWRVDQYREDKATAAPIAESQVPPSSTVPPGTRPQPAFGRANSPALGQGATGGAAPPVVENPYAGGPK